MSARSLAMGLGLLGALALASGCQFEPDLSRFEECGADGTCPAGYTCLAEAQRCLPDCGAQGPCAPMSPDAGTDGGTGDGGSSDGGMDGGPDAGEPLSLVTVSLPVGTETIAYTESLKVRGGKPPYSFRPTETLPQGFMLDGGVLWGTPSTPGTFRVAVEVKDQNSPAASVGTAYDLRVRPLLRLAGPEFPASAYLDAVYEEQLSATGGTPPYRFTLAPGNSLPDGLGLDTDGGVTGTPSDSGTYTFRVRVTDSDPQPQTVSRELELSVTTPPLLLEWSTRSVPDGRLGTPYHYALKVAGGGSPVTWKLEAGTTPLGVGFDAKEATLTGAPTQTGVYSFTISAADSLTKVERTFKMTVY